MLSVGVGSESYGLSAVFAEPINDPQLSQVEPRKGIVA
jgi:hypothetical protein